MSLKLSAKNKGGGMMAVYQPSITAVTLSTNPVNISATFKISVSVTED